MKHPKVVFDTATLEAQLRKLESLLEKKFPDGHPSAFFALWDGLVLETLFSDAGIVAGEDGALEHHVQLRLGPRFDVLMQAFAPDTAPPVTGHMVH